MTIHRPEGGCPRAPPLPEGLQMNSFMCHYCLIERRWAQGVRVQTKWKIKEKLEPIDNLNKKQTSLKR